MNSVANGLTATLLMFVPLLAVPFLAAFGVSMPTQDIAAGAVELDSLEFAPELPEPGAGHSATARRTPDDLFAPIDHTQPTGNSLPPAASTSNTAAMSHPLSLPALDSPTGNARTANERVEETSQPTSLMVNTPSHQPTETEWDNPFKDSPAFGATPSSESITPHQSQNDDKPFTPRSDYPQDFSESNSSTRTVSSDPPNPFDWNSAPGERQIVAEENESASPAVDDSVFGPPAGASNSSRALAVIDQNEPAGRTLFGPPNTSNRRVDVPDPQRTPAREPVAPNNAGWEPPPASTPRTPSNSVTTTKPKTWLAADKRLRELNMRYQIVPAENDRLFHLRCVWTSPNNPRITRNFEASGRQPLEAAWRVLAQVEEWRASSRNSSSP